MLNGPADATYEFFVGLNRDLMFFPCAVENDYLELNFPGDCSLFTPS